MTQQQFDAWITEYGKAWEALDPDAVMTLMDRDDLTYYESTFNEPRRSWNEINRLWQVVPSNQKDVKFWHEVMFCTTDRVLAHVKVTRTIVPSGEKQDIDAAFVFGINTKGLCTYFRQWRMLRP
jgi:hypothetical protein